MSINRNKPNKLPIDHLLNCNSQSKKCNCSGYWMTMFRQLTDFPDRCSGCLMTTIYWRIIQPVNTMLLYMNWYHSRTRDYSPVPPVTNENMGSTHTLFPNTYTSLRNDNSSPIVFKQEMQFHQLQISSIQRKPYNGVILSSMFPFLSVYSLKFDLIVG